MRIETIDRIKLLCDFACCSSQIALRAYAQQSNVNIEIEYIVLRIHHRSER